MTDRDVESGLELVLDNRKLIIAFAVLIAFCGCFFVLGFIEGKRQGFQAGSLATVQSVPRASSEETPAQASGLANSSLSSKPPKEGTGEQRMDWYKSVNRRGGEPEGMQPATGTSANKKTMPPGSPEKSKAQTTHSKPVTYSVQIGAFRQLREAEVKAKALRSKGYDCRVESPHPPEQLYLLKVGKFNSRADAVAMQLRLKKNGITSFVKTN